MTCPVPTMSIPLELPESGDFSPRAIERWFANVPRELAMSFLDDAERNYVRDYYEEAGLLRPWRRRFFLRHFADSIAAASAHLLQANPAPVILDLGCGTGSQALFFALQGARVVGVDMDEVALGIFRKRIEVYSALAGRPLPIALISGNVFNIDYSAHGPFSGVYSLFAFNMMQPSADLVDRLLPHLAPGARWAVLDGNQSSFWCKLLPGMRRPVWTPAAMAAELAKRGFSVVSQQGGVTLPPVCWTVLPWPLARAVDVRLSGTQFCPVSCQTFAVLGSNGRTRTP